MTLRQIPNQKDKDAAVVESHRRVGKLVREIMDTHMVESKLPEDIAWELIRSSLIVSEYE